MYFAGPRLIVDCRVSRESLAPSLAMFGGPAQRADCRPCAFGFRRFLAQQKFGDEFVQTIIGQRQAINKYPIDQWGGGIFSWTNLPKDRSHVM